MSNPQTPPRVAPPPFTAPRLTGLLLLSLTLAGWSSSPLFLKYFVSYIDAWTSNGWRYAISALFWLPALRAAAASHSGGPRGAARGDGGNIGVAGNAAGVGIWRDALWPSAFNVLGQVAFAWVLYLNVDPGLMSFLLRVQIVSVTIGAFLLFPDERRLIRHPGYWLGAGMVLAATACVIFLGRAPPGGATAWGIVAGISSGALFGGYAVSVRACMARYPSMHSFAVISLYTAAALVALMLLFGEQRGLTVPTRLTAWQGLMLVISALAGIALGHVFYYASIARLGVAVSSGVLLLQPFATAALSYFIFGERLTWQQWSAGGLGVLGAGIVLRTQDVVRRI